MFHLVVGGGQNQAHRGRSLTLVALDGFQVSLGLWGLWGGRVFHIAVAENARYFPRADGGFSFSLTPGIARLRAVHFLQYFHNHSFEDCLRFFRHNSIFGRLLDDGAITSGDRDILTSQHREYRPAQPAFPNVPEEYKVSKVNIKAQHASDHRYLCVRHRSCKSFEFSAISCPSTIRFGLQILVNVKDVKATLQV